MSVRVLYIAAVLSLPSSATVGQVVLQLPNIFEQQQQYRSVPVAPSEAKKRALVVGYIRALTSCIAGIANREDAALAAYRENRFNPYLAAQIPRCTDQAADLGAKYDQVYGPGTADEFIRGPYTADLARAVLARMKDTLQPRLDAYDRSQARAKEEAKQRAVRDAEDRRIEEERQGEALRRRVEEDRAATAKAEAVRKTAEVEKAAADAKAAQQKKEQIDIAKRSFSILKEKLYTCVDSQLPQLVKSGESADVLANAALTICNRALVDAEDASLEVITIEQGQRPTGLVEEAFRDKSKAVVKERAVADAVQAKAGVGQFTSK